jgi:hypothetical protein
MVALLAALHRGRYDLAERASLLSRSMGWYEAETAAYCGVTEQLDREAYREN